jgi:hypothetical protein
MYRRTNYILFPGFVAAAVAATVCQITRTYLELRVFVQQPVIFELQGSRRALKPSPNKLFVKCIGFLQMLFQSVL